MFEPIWIPTTVCSIAHTFSQATIQDVAISGSALSSNGGNIILLDNDANGDGEDDNYVLSQAKDGKLNQPFGLTWEANQTGDYIIFAIAEDSKGNRISSAPSLISVIDAIGKAPVVSLDQVNTLVEYFGGPVVQKIEATASDSDGQVAEVQFFVNGELFGSDSASPYSVNLEINATGHFEVYAVARDNMGNITTSNVRRIIMVESDETALSPITFISPSTTYLGSVSSISANYISIDRVYDSGIYALVYVGGVYAGLADALPMKPQDLERLTLVKLSFLIYLLTP